MVALTLGIPLANRLIRATRLIIGGKRTILHHARGNIIPRIRAGGRLRIIRTPRIPLTHGSSRRATQRLSLIHGIQMTRQTDNSDNSSDSGKTTYNVICL